jgi:hypothetical protein
VSWRGGSGDCMSVAVSKQMGNHHHSRRGMTIIKAMRGWKAAGGEIERFGEEYTKRK